MSKSRRPVIIAAIVFGALLVCLAGALIVLLDADTYKHRLEAAVSDALEMEVRLGRVGVRFSPGLHVRFDDVRISNHGALVASAQEARLGIEILPLLKRDVRIRTVTLKAPVLSVERDLDGRFNIERPETSEEILPALAIGSISFSEGTLAYKDQQSGDALEATKCSLDLKHLDLPGGDRADVLQRLSFTAEIACGELRRGDLAATGLSADATFANGVLEFDPLTLHAFGAQGTGNIRADFTGEGLVYHARYDLPQIPLEELFTQLAAGRAAEGMVDFTADLSSQGTTLDELRRNVSGEFSMRGENLVLTGIDLDRSLAQFESSQTFSLVDAGAVFLVGPFGLVATKGYDLASLAQGSGGGRSAIRMLVSDWQVEKGVARARDVALATGQHRLAAQGRLDLVRERFDGLTIALVDAKGCVRVKQELRGPFASVETTKPSIMELISGPTRSLLRRGMELFTDRECEVFYSGSVPSPR